MSNIKYVDLESLVSFCIEFRAEKIFVSCEKFLAYLKIYLKEKRKHILSIDEFEKIFKMFFENFEQDSVIQEIFYHFSYSQALNFDDGNEEHKF